MPFGSALLYGLGGLAGDFLASNSAKNANNTNIKMQREQQTWEKEMSNTAVQRRAADIRAAGGNPALAFETGASASTPSVSPAQVQPTIKPGMFDMLQKQLAMTQLGSAKAEARSANAKATMDETDAANYVGEGGTGRLKWAQQWSRTGKLSLEIDKLRSDRDIAQTTADILKQNETAIITKMAAIADREKMTTDSMQKLAESFGITGNDASIVSRMLFQAFQTMMGLAR